MVGVEQPRFEERFRETKISCRKRRFAGVVLVSDTENWVYRNRAFSPAT
jgi:hypothetical protein